MLNLNTIDKICECLSNEEIAEFHRITKFNPNIHLLNHRVISDDDASIIGFSLGSRISEDQHISEDQYISMENFLYIINNFPIKKIRILLKHRNAFYDYLNNITYLWLDQPISQSNLEKLVIKNKNIQELHLRYPTNISSLKFLSHCKDITTLSVVRKWFGELPISDISVLENCRKLECINLPGTGIHDISSLSYCKNLKELDLSNTKVSDISVLINCKELEYLNLRGTRVSDISTLAYCPDLGRLKLSRTQISNISALKNCKNIEDLDISDTKISDILALGGHNNLRELNLRKTEVSDILILAGCIILKRLVITSGTITKQQIDHLQNNIFDLRIDQYDL
jgi:Leucine-rich repeat (LRR) protein